MGAVPGRCLVSCSAKAVPSPRGPHPQGSGTPSPTWAPCGTCQRRECSLVLLSCPQISTPPAAKRPTQHRRRQKLFVPCPFVRPLPAPPTSLQPRQALNSHPLAPGWADCGCCSGEGGDAGAGPQQVPPGPAAAALPVPARSQVADFSGFSGARCCWGIGQGPLLPLARGLLLPQQGWQMCCQMCSQMCSYGEQPHPSLGLC